MEQLGLNLEAPRSTVEQTPIELRGAVWLKREDLFTVAGAYGGKVRTCWALAQGAPGLVTAGARSSPQVNIVAHIARHLGIPARAHTPQGALSPELIQAQALGCEIVQHRAGYNSVIRARARADAAASEWREIPFGMECQEAVTQVRGQVRNVPADVRRVVVPVGSAMSLAGVLAGLGDEGLDLPVLGVVVGADPSKRLDTYAPGWRGRCTLVPAGVAYDKHVHATVEGLVLDPVYEAKCSRFLQPADLLWVVGVRNSLAK